VTADRGAHTLCGRFLITAITTKREDTQVAKKGRKRRNRRKRKANHGKRPNAGRK
jgi:hypothetical protein